MKKLKLQCGKQNGTVTKVTKCKNVLFGLKIALEIAIFAILLYIYAASIRSIILNNIAYSQCLRQAQENNHAWQSLCLNWEVGGPLLAMASFLALIIALFRPIKIFLVIFSLFAAMTLVGVYFDASIARFFIPLFIIGTLKLGYYIFKTRYIKSHN